MAVALLTTLAVTPAAKAGAGNESQKASCDALVKYIMDRAKTPDPGAWTMLGKLHEAGNCFPVDKTKAAEYFDRAAEEGDAYAYPLLGYMYANGLGVKRDADEARYWFRKFVLFNILADREERLQRTALALDGRKIPPLMEEELEWMEDVLAADPREQVKIAIRLRDGDGLPLDREAAYALLHKSMSKNAPEAYYEMGRGLLARDYVLGRSFREQEVHWALGNLSRAAKVRYAPAEKMLGLIYADPDGYRYLPKWGYILLLRAKEGGAEDLDATIAQLEAVLSEKLMKRGRRQAKEKDLILP